MGDLVLAIDIGNSTTDIGLFDREGTLRFRSALATSRNASGDQCAMNLMGVFSLYQADIRAVSGAILSSVVPSVTANMCAAVERLTGKRPLLVGSGVKTGLNIKTDNPAQVGSDRVVDAVAACAKYPKPIMVVDMGTSTTVSVIDGKGDFLGGMIIPGLRLAVDALSAKASQLPQNISLEAPEKMIGANTLDCMKSGSVYGCAAMLDGLLGRVERALGASVTAVATGGNSSLVIPLCRRKFHLEPDLLLEGLRILYEKNTRRGAPAGEPRDSGIVE